MAVASTQGFDPIFFLISTVVALLEGISRRGDPSLSRTLLGQYAAALLRSRRWLKFVALHEPVSRSQTQHILPFHVTSLHRGKLNCRAMHAKQFLCLPADAILRCQWFVTMTARRIAKPQSHSRSLNAQLDNRLLCNTSSATTRADLLESTLKCTKTFVSRVYLQERASRIRTSFL
jgi:hypothetical protein